MVDGPVFTYRPEKGTYGFPYVPPKTGARFTFSSEKDVVTIEGNQEGLLQLAKYLISLAYFDGPQSYHIHLDSSVGMPADSQTAVIRKEA